MLFVFSAAWICCEANELKYETKEKSCNFWLKSILNSSLFTTGTEAMALKIWRLTYNSPPIH